MQQKETDRKVSTFADRVIFVTHLHGQSGTSSAHFMGKLSIQVNMQATRKPAIDGLHQVLELGVELRKDNPRSIVCVFWQARVDMSIHRVRRLR